MNPTKQEIAAQMEKARAIAESICFLHVSDEERLEAATSAIATALADSQWQIKEFRRQIAEHCQQLAVEFNWSHAGDVASGIGQFVESLPLPAPPVKEKPG